MSGEKNITRWQTYTIEVEAPYREEMRIYANIPWQSGLNPAQNYMWRPDTGWKPDPEYSVWMPASFVPPRVITIKRNIADNK